MAELDIEARILAVMQELRGVEATRRNPQGGYNYASHDDVTALVRDRFVKHGITQQVNMTNCVVLPGEHVMVTVTVRWQSVGHDSFKEYTSYAIQPCTSSKNAPPRPTAQQIGMALSYAVKYVMFKNLMLTGDPEPDSDGAKDREPEPAEIPKEAIRFMSELDSASSLEEVTGIGKRIQEWGRIGETRGLKDQVQAKFVAARQQIARGER